MTYSICFSLYHNLTEPIFRLILCDGDIERKGDINRELNTTTSQREVDTITIALCSSSINQSVSTVLFHVCQALSQGHTIHKDMLRLLRAGAQSPDLVLRPFVLFLGLAMSSVKKFRQSVGDAMRAVFVKQIEIEIRYEVFYPIPERSDGIGYKKIVVHNAYV